MLKVAKRLSILAIISGVGLNAATAENSFAQQAPTNKSVSGWYVTAGAGASWATPTKFTNSGAGTVPPGLPGAGTQYTFNQNGTFNLGGSVAIDAGVGYDFGNNIRSEVTYLFNNFSTNNASTSGSAAVVGVGNFNFNANASVSGSVNTNSVLASIYYDIPTKSKWVPYVGGGLGWSNVTISNVNVSYNVTAAGVNNTGVVNAQGGSASALGYQAKIGVSYLASKNTDVYLEGVYMGNTPVTIRGVNIGGLNDFGLKAGFRYRFGK